MNKRQTKIRVSGIVLKFLRESSGFTIEEIAEKLNVTPQKIKHIEEEKKTAYSPKSITRFSNK